MISSLSLTLSRFGKKGRRKRGALRGDKEERVQGERKEEFNKYKRIDTF